MLVTTYIIRNEEEHEVEVNFDCSFDSGEYIERNHPCNGYGAGYDYNNYSCTCETLDNVILTSEELQKAWERVEFRR